MSFLLFLSKLDLFNRPISFNYKKQSERTTPFGIIFSLLIYMFMFYSFSKSDVFIKKSPIVISQTLSNNLANPIHFSNSKLIVFQLADELHNFYYDPSIFNIRLKRMVFEIDKNGMTVPQYQYIEELRPCIKEEISLYTEKFDNSGLKGSFCLKNKTFSIYGQITERKSSYFSVGIYSCDNLTSNNTCKSKKEINSFLSNAKYFTMAMHNSLINVEDFENPMKLNLKGIFNKIDINLSKYSFIYLKNTHLKSDEGFFFEENRDFIDFTFDHQEQDINFKQTDQPFVSYSFFASTNFDKTQRKYQKISEMLGSFSGSAQFIMFFCFFITNFCLKIQTMKTILNNLFEFQTIKKIKKELAQNNTNSVIESIQKIEISCKDIKKNMKTDKELDVQKIELGENSNKDFKKIDSDLIIEKTFVSNKIFEEKLKNIANNTNKFDKSKIKDIDLENLKQKKSQNNFSLNFFEYFRFKLSSFCHFKKSEKQKLIERAEYSYLEQMDILNVLSKIQEIEKLKLVLLNDDQLFLFNLLAKPKIYIDGENIHREISRSSIMSQRIINYKSPREKEKIISTYEQVVNNTKQNEINQRILNLINDKFTDTLSY